MITEAENIFFERIHCNFPYQDTEQCIRLIEEAATLPSDSMFKLIEEVCRIPESENATVSKDRLQEILAVVATKFNHPLKDIVLDAAIKMLHGVLLPAEDVLQKMEQVRKFTGQYSALSILYFSSNNEKQILEPVWDSIICEWQAKGT